ncbi:hypothetical protein FYK55_19685 [Roseiconus nitratireducens]|uniref:Uncharacterized protein n=1 Tax=Roseiconus nitratireducens TaxID=2605748 RepID=A0A5M6D4A3_9BACT|nr:hypothetical protein [Roseiconus nitratireducens]KAA5541112.1 hypothetical protein FYK55_19685 [Roseiconus nitratireducens]
MIALSCFIVSAVWKRATRERATPEFEPIRPAAVPDEVMRPAIDRLQDAKDWFESRPHGIIEFEVNKLRSAVADGTSHDWRARIVFDRSRVAVDILAKSATERVVFDGKEFRTMHRNGQSETYALHNRASSVSFRGLAFPSPGGLNPWWVRAHAIQFESDFRLDEDRNCFADGWLMHDGEECFVFHKTPPGSRYVIGKYDQRIRGIRHGGTRELFHDFHAVAPGIDWPLGKTGKRYRDGRLATVEETFITRFDFETEPPEDAFVLDFKPGCRVLDARSLPMRTYWQGDDAEQPATSNPPDDQDVDSVQPSGASADPSS